MIKYRVGDKIRRISSKKTRPNPHPIYTIKEINKSGKHTFYLLEDSKGDRFSMVEKGVQEYHEKIEVFNE